MVVDTSYGDGSLKVKASVDSRDETLYASLAPQGIDSLKALSADFTLHIQEDDAVPFSSMAGTFTSGDDSVVFDLAMSHVQLAQSTSDFAWAYPLYRISIDTRIAPSFDEPMSTDLLLTYVDSFSS